MANVAFLVLFLTKMVYFTSCCTEFFCQEELIRPENQPKCGELMLSNIYFRDCKCTHLLTPEKMCDQFSDANFQVVVSMNFARNVFTEAEMAITSKRTRHSEFNYLTQMFLNYLPLTNITDFGFSSYPCGAPLRLFNRARRCHDAKGYEIGASLNLASAFNVNKVQRLKLNNNCISNLYGSFSSIMPDLTDLDLSSNLLAEIKGSTFGALNRLKKLDLSSNKLLHLDETALFRGMRSLMHLDLSLNHRLTIVEDVFEELVNLQWLNINHIRLPYSSKIIFRNTALRELHVSYCALNVSELLAITCGLKHVQTLTLEGNEIATLPLQIFFSNSELRFLNLKNNWFHDVSNIALQFSHPVTIDLSGNCFQCSSLRNCSLGNRVLANRQMDNITCQSCCLNMKAASSIAKLAKTSADFRNNPIKHISVEFIQSVAHLKRLYLSYSTKLTVSVQNLYQRHKQPNFTHLSTQIFLSEYTFEVCDLLSLLHVNQGRISDKYARLPSNAPFTMYNITIRNVKYQDMNNILADKYLSNKVCDFTCYVPNCSCYTIGNDATITINCTGRNMSTFPVLDQFTSPVKLYLSSNQIQSTKTITSHDWSILKELYLDNNQIENLENFEPTQILQTLNIQNNKLVQFPTETLQTLSTNGIRTMLAGNPWKCDCDDVKTKIILLNPNFEDFHNVACKSAYSTKVFLLQNATDSELCPFEKTNHVRIEILLPIFASFLVLFGAGIVTYYRHKKLIKLWLFTRGCCLRCVTAEEIDAGKPYDAFVSYSSHDEEWVAHHLVQGLENGKPKYKLCLHTRDWLAGEWIVKQILRSVKLSRRTIIVLTNNFVESDWSLMEFAAAYKQALSDGVSRVIVVIPHEIPEAGKLGEDLRKFITLNTYLKWQDPYFWSRLRDSMPRVKK